MGSGIAEVAARAGLDVVLTEVDEQAADAARQRVTGSLQRAADKGKLSRQDADAARARIAVRVGLEHQADRQLVIEAATENERIKTALFTDLDRIVTDPQAVLASNTSSLPISRIATATSRPHRVVGIHFFNPAPVQALVEVIPGMLTDADTVELAVGFAEAVGKTVVRAKDRSGFVVNALLIPYLVSSIRMLEAGHATAEDIDNGMVLGCAHPMGPLRLCDLVGLDTVRSAAQAMYDEYAEPHLAPPALLHRMVEANLLGRKTGRGFYQY